MVTQELLAWYGMHGRDLPWRRTRDPYRILVSELMLQQTQVPRVIPKYEAFLREFPTIKALAEAPRTDVLRAWQGLGYNSRAVRLHALAKVVAEAGGTLPTTREELLRLPGIGPYTAGAIMVFAHDKPALSVDVNVERVLRRAFFSRLQRPAKQDIERLAQELVEQSGAPHDWQSALMDLGSAICTAKDPRCSQCPLYEHCRTRGVHAEEAAKPKQGRFIGSNRWWRGQILRVLLRGPARAEALPAMVCAGATDADRAACAAALAGMVEEGIVTSTRGMLRLTEQ